MSTNVDAPESSFDAVVSSQPPINTDVAVSNGVKVGDKLLESETETLATEPTSDRDGGGDVVVQPSIDDARVSGDETGAVSENVEKSEKVLDENGANYEEKEGEYKVKDLVWAKVKSYPWWPGQIFDPSAATDKAKKHSNKKGFLIAYFGDQSFAWNEASKIKHFRKNFVKMEKQSNSTKFLHAVSCALDEASRRVEFGLSCSCLSKEVIEKFKSQVFVNAGIKKEASEIEGGDNFSTVATFKSANIVQSVQDLGKEQFDGVNRLEIYSVRAQLLVYNRWKGYNQLTTYQIIDKPENTLVDEWDTPIMEKEKIVEDEKPPSVSVKKSSKKRKLNDSDSVKHKTTSKKERSSTKESKVTTNGSSRVRNGEKKSKKDSGKRKTDERNDSKEESNKKSSVSSSKSLFGVGDSICRIAKQLSESPATVKKESKKSKASLMEGKRKQNSESEDESEDSEAGEDKDTESDE